MSFITEWWNYILAGVAVLAAIAASYFGGKKIGTTQTQAKADVQAAKVESQQVADVAKKQSENTEKANSVKQNNAALSDDAARNKLRQSQFNSDD
ncbi:hypothetical protein [Pantoea piersonii]|jgi:uncharacterized protein (UPF0333 family)|uniref:hypothetical protein n=1 Tax=Pantoea piersonii TaxID=2364647 RepID=UPI000EA3F329|nr:hypothetical protein [Pantoea piersonii]MBZ6385133.1 hypothetical protein [Pantoea piersonii]MBZ6385209.1 hypothetical protein [Pantoea piersonii]MBZ6398661.1 hypothetical protein [Pantoea piersonii]MBZ6398737.1 hypothetical protein [Pantoea piersonii]MBZ6406591.1 hypothetical protein [Pantoea piersonii]